MTFPDPGLLLAAELAAVFVGMSKGGLPVMGMLGVPVLSLAMSPVTAAALLLPIYIVSDVVGLYLYRREFSGRNLKILLPFALIGVAIGWATASIISERWVTLLIGLLSLAFCIDSWLKRKRTLPPRPADIPRGAFWGTIAGFTSFISHSGGPPYQMYVLPQKLPKMVFAGTSTILFAIINWAKLLPYWALGEFSTDNMEVAALLVPVALISTYAGYRLTRILPEDLFFRIILGALFLISLELIYKGLAG